MAWERTVSFLPDEISARYGVEQGPIRFIVNDLMEATAKDLVGLARDIIFRLRWRPPIGTPIATGRASKSWKVSVGTRSFSVVPGPAMVTSLVGYKLTKGDIYISNNQRYIATLNAGWSKQSPPGFVETAIEHVVNQRRHRKIGR